MVVEAAVAQGTVVDFGYKAVALAAQGMAEEEHSGQSDLGLCV